MGGGLSWDEMVLVGRVAKPHGLRGWVVINPETDFADERFARGSELWVRTGGRMQAVTVASCRFVGRRPVVGFEGVERVEEAEPFVGLELRVPESALARLPDGVFYEHQLIGCMVESTGGEIGRVERVDGGMGASRLVIGGPKGEILVPLTRAICLEIDVSAQRIRIEPPEGLLDLNEPTGRRRKKSRARRA